MFFIELRTADGQTRVQVPTKEPFYGVDGRMTIYAKANAAIAADTVVSIYPGREGWEVNTYHEGTGQRCWVGVARASVASGAYGAFLVGGHQARSVFANRVNIGTTGSVQLTVSGSSPHAANNTREANRVFATKLAGAASQGNVTTHNDMVFCGRMIYT